MRRERYNKHRYSYTKARKLISLAMELYMLPFSIWLLYLVSRRVREITKSDYFFRHVCPCVRMKNLAPAGRILIEFDI